MLTICCYVVVRRMRVGVPLVGMWVGIVLVLWPCGTCGLGAGDEVAPMLLVAVLMVVLPAASTRLCRWIARG